MSAATDAFFIPKPSWPRNALTKVAFDGAEKLADCRHRASIRVGAFVPEISNVGEKQGREAKAEDMAADHDCAYGNGNGVKVRILVAGRKCRYKESLCYPSRCLQVTLGQP